MAQYATASAFKGSGSGGGSGDVVGPASATDSNVAMFDGTTGKLIKDSGISLSGSNTGDQTTVTGNSGSTNALKSATTTVNVSSAAAPSINQVLTATSGTAATWQTPSSGFSDPMTTDGDIIVRNASNTTVRLPAGTSGQLLQTNGNTAIPSWVTPAASGGLSIQTKTASFTAADGKTYLVSSAAARAITLPAASADIQFWVKDNTGSAETNNFTITRAGSEKVENVAANKILQTNYGSWHFVCDGTDWWII